MTKLSLTYLKENICALEQYQIREKSNNILISCRLMHLPNWTQSLAAAGSGRKCFASCFKLK